MGNQNQENSELDLWAFDEDLDSVESDTAKSQPAANRVLPQPRELRAAKSTEVTPSEKSAEPMQTSASHTRHPQQSTPLAQAPNPESDFDDLEDWDDLPDEPAIPPLTTELPSSPSKSLAEASTTKPTFKDTQSEKVSNEDEFSPQKNQETAPLVLRPRLGLSLIERTGMIVLATFLVLAGLFIYQQSIYQLPNESNHAGKPDFPLKGTLVTVDSATSYWRAPVNEGPKVDTYRRGTVLLPVLVLKISEGRGAIRVLFRNNEGETMGDAVTRTIQGADTFEIAATAGFDDVGMHAAYRTGGLKPWKIQVFEASTENASGQDVKKLFELNISTELR